MTEAEQFVDDNPQELQDSVEGAPEHSQASQSLFQQNFRFEDGSIAIVTSFMGSSAIVNHFANSDDVPNDLVSQHTDPDGN